MKKMFAVKEVAAHLIKRLRGEIVVVVGGK
jgi:hypothetical protein